MSDNNVGNKKANKVVVVIIILIVLVVVGYAVIQNTNIMNRLTGSESSASEGSNGLYGQTVSAEPTEPLKIDLKDCDIVFDKSEFYYTGEKLTPVIDVQNKQDMTLIPKEEYDVIYSNNKYSGKASIKIKPKDDSSLLTGVLVSKFTIKKSKKNLIKARKSYVCRSDLLKNSVIRLKAKEKGHSRLCYKSNSKNVSVNKKGKVTVNKYFFGSAKITISSKNQKPKKKVTITSRMPTSYYVLCSGSPEYGERMTVSGDYVKVHGPVRVTTNGTPILQQAGFITYHVLSGNKYKMGSGNYSYTQGVSQYILSISLPFTILNMQ